MNLSVALSIQDLFGKFGPAFLVAFVRIAELKARIFRRKRILVPHELCNPQQPVARCRRAVKIGAMDIDIEGLLGREGWIVAGQIEFHAFRQELLDTEAEHRAGRPVGGVGAQLETPSAGRGVLGQRQMLEVVAGIARIGLPGRGELFAAPWIFEDRLNRLHGNRPSVRIADKDRYIEAFTGPVKIPAGIGKQPHGSGALADDIVFRQIQRRLAHREQRHLFVFPGQHDLCFSRPFGKQRVSVAVRLGVRQHLSLPIEPGDVDTPNRPAVDQRTHECIGALIEDAEMHTKVADVEIRRLRVVSKTAGLRHDCDVHAGLPQFADVLNRNVRNAAPVGPRFGGEASDVDAVHETTEIVQLVVAHRSVQRCAAVVISIFIAVTRSRKSGSRSFFTRRNWISTSGTFTVTTGSPPF